MPDIFAFVCAGIYGKLKGQEFIQEGEPQLFAYGVCILIAQPFRLFQQLCGLLFISALLQYLLNLPGTSLRLFHPYLPGLWHNPHHSGR